MLSLEALGESVAHAELKATVELVGRLAVFVAATDEVGQIELIAAPTPLVGLTPTAVPVEVIEPHNAFLAAVVAVGAG